MSGQIYQMITDRVVAMLEAGTVPWHKGWTGGAAVPMNAVTKKEYRGFNHFFLRSACFASPYWMSFKQAQERGGNVRKGEKGMPVIFWKRSEYTKSNAAGEDETRQGFILRYYTVFNVAQIDGLKMDLPEIPRAEHNTIAEAEAIVANMPKRPKIEHGPARCYYRPSTDTVNMPEMGLFSKVEEYYASLFHELTHSTGHETRLNRRPSTEIRRFGDKEYSREELVAEMGAAFLSAACGIEPATIENSAAYLQGWLAVLKEDSKAIIHAAAQAQKAADFIQGISFAAATNDEEPAAPIQAAA